MKQERPVRTGGKARIVRAVNGSPVENMEKVIELSGGIASLIGKDDIVVIKPNLQWWNHGAPNIPAFEAFVEMIMARPGGFHGEVVIGENTHRGGAPNKKTAWAILFSGNAAQKEKNYNQLCDKLKKKFGDRFSVCYWIDVDSGGKRVYSPADGAGYVYCDGTGGVPLESMDNGLSGSERREVIMSYPIMVTDKGTTVDLRNGVWEDGAYTTRAVKFINFAALNHHSTYCGMTSSVKNYFGVTDISNGADPHKHGKLTGDYFNFHAFAFDEWAAGPVPGIMGAEVGMFMNRIRKADLNIVTAEWTGLASRTEKPVAHTRIVAASTDPVALDVHMAKYVLYANSGCKVHNPQWEAGPLHAYLASCAHVTGDCFDETDVAVRSFDYAQNEMQRAEVMEVRAPVKWGNNIKMLAKYLLLRYGKVAST